MFSYKPRINRSTLQARKRVCVLNGQLTLIVSFIVSLSPYLEHEYILLGWMSLLDITVEILLYLDFSDPDTLCSKVIRFFQYTIIGYINRTLFKHTVVQIHHRCTSFCRCFENHFELRRHSCWI